MNNSRPELQAVHMPIGVCLFRSCKARVHLLHGTLRRHSTIRCRQLVWFCWSIVRLQGISNTSTMHSWVVCSTSLTG